MASIFARTIIIYILLSFSMKIMGKRQIGELDVSDLISTLLISELAAIPIDDPDIPLFNAIIPILFIATLEIIIPYLKNKYTKIKKYVEGQPEFVIFKGELIQKALKENRISVNELVCELRMQGVGDINSVYYAVLEQNGKITVIPKAAYQAPTLQQMGLQSQENGIYHIVIDGDVINTHSLQQLNLSRTQIDTILQERALPSKEIYLMLMSDSGDIRIVKKEKCT